MMDRVHRESVLWLGVLALGLIAIGVALNLWDVLVFDIVVVSIGSVVGAVAWIMALLLTAQRQQWVWLIVVALTNLLGAMVYALARADETA